MKGQIRRPGSSWRQLKRYILPGIPDRSDRGHLSESIVLILLNSIRNGIRSQTRSEATICVVILTREEVEFLRASSYPCKCIYVVPPSIGRLEARLRDRDYPGYITAEKEEEMKDKVQQADTDIALVTSQGGEGSFDALLENDDVQTAVDQLLQYLHIWFPNLGSVRI
jgi:Guanylate kinase